MSAPIVSGSSWMTQSFDQIGPLPLRAVAVPGAHDSGMSVLTNSTLGSGPCNTQTQSIDVLGQLNCGVRYFDFRPVTWPGEPDFFHGHFSAKADLYWGSTGQSLSSALGQLAQFIQQPGSEQEVVVFKLSHFLKMGELPLPIKLIDGGPFDTDDFQALAAAIEDGIGPFLFTADDPGVSLNDATLGDLAGSPGRIVVVFDLAGGAEGGFPADLIDPSRGLFSYNDSGTGAANLVVYDNYYSQSDYAGMEADQQQKFQEFTPGPGVSFLLSWTLTQTNPVSSTCIADLASTANGALDDVMQAWATQGIVAPGNIPNVVYTDYLADPSVALAACMYINYLGT